MYERMKKQVIAKVSKQLDKTIRDSRSDIMCQCLMTDHFKESELFDSLFFEYFKRYGFYLIDDSYESLIANKVPTRQFIKFTDLDTIRKNVPRYINKAQLELRYVSYYYKYHYKRLVQALINSR